MGRRTVRAGSDERAATAPLGVVAMVAIAIVLVATTAAFVFDLGTALRDPAPQAKVTVDVVDDQVRFEHRGGDALNASELDLVVETDDIEKRVPCADGRLEGDDGAFTAGERWRYCQRSTPGEAVTLRLVHERSQQVLATIQRNASATAHSGLEYQCASSQTEYNGEPGWTTVNLTNYGPGDVTIEEVTLAATNAERLTDTTTSVALYVDADGDFDYYDGPDGYVNYPAGSGVDVTGSGATIDFSADGNYQKEPTIAAGDTAWVSLFRFTDAAGNPADMAGAELTLTVHLADGTTRTYEIVVPTEEDA
jgi:FlaG/FlaF family flagellin (archaellin)